MHSSFTRDGFSWNVVAAVGCGALLALGGCAVGPDYHRPLTPVDAHYANAGQPGLARRYGRRALLDELLRSAARQPGGRCRRS